LGQVWTNLIHNALDAMEGEGTLEIRARTSREGVVCQISDTGSGIPESIRPRIFDPFFTTKPQGRGTGLGLAITYGIVVNQHRGTLRVDSRPGRTVFEVALPRRLPEGPQV
jgi:signal transduction histidine kinase